MVCKNCGKDIDENMEFCPHCGKSTKQQVKDVKNTYNTLSIAGFIVSFFSGVVGLVLSIMGFVKAKKEGSKTGFGLAGIIISSVSILITIIVAILVGSMFASMFNGLFYFGGSQYFNII